MKYAVNFKNVMIAVLFTILGMFTSYAQNWKCWFVTPGANTAQFPIDNYVSNGVLNVPPSASPWSYYATILTNDDTFCLGNSFRYEVRIKNPLSTGGIDAYDINNDLYGCDGNHIGNWFMGAAWALVHAQAYNGNLNENYLDSLVQNLSNWCTIGINVSPDSVRHLYNGNIVHTMANTVTTNTLVQIHISIKGSGFIDYVKLWDSTNTLIYFEDFTSINYASGQSCLVPPNCLNTPLPMTFLNFEVAPQNQNVYLSWQIEKNGSNHSFEIERSNDNHNFEAITKLREIDNVSNYSYIDKNLTRGVYYYRLENIDTDGKVNYSEVRKISIEENAPLFFSPNPANQSILFSEKVEKITVWGIGGNLIKEITNQDMIDISDFNEGIYFVKCSQNGRITTHKLVKIK